MTADFHPDLLKGAHFIVTGGGTGLGRAMAMRMAELGAKITICGRRTEPLDKTVNDIRSAGGTAEGLSCNIRDKESVAEMFTEAEKRQGDVTGLLNNAAANFLAPTHLLSPNAFDAIVQTNLNGSFYCTTEAGRRWIERETPGVVLSIVTTYAETGSAFVVPSAVSKAGISAMTKSLAAEWGVYGIRLNAIAPGPFPTKGAWDRLAPDGKISKLIENRVPMKRVGEKIELANLAAFLMSGLSSYLTGDIINLDGGEVLTSGGQFNFFTLQDRDQVHGMFDQMKKKR